MSLDVPSNERNLTHIVSSRLTEYNIIPLNVSTEIFQIILLTTVYGEMAGVALRESDIRLAKESFESVLNEGVKLLFHRGQCFARIICQHQIVRLRWL